MDRYSYAVEFLAGLGIAKPQWLDIVVVHEALQRGIRVERRSARPGYILTYGGRRFRWHRALTNLNSPLANRVAGYKDVTSRILENRGVNVAESFAFRAGDAQRAWDWAAPLLPVVLKPLDGLQGKGVHVGIETAEDFFDAFHEISKDGRRVLVEQQLFGVERRCLVIDNRFVAAIQRLPANVVGDGKSTIAELVTTKNGLRNVIHKPLVLGPAEIASLASQDLRPDSILESGVRVVFGALANLRTGGDAIDATDEISAEEQAFVESAARALPGLRLSGMDVLFPRNGVGQRPAIIEINHNPMITMHHFPNEGKPRNVASRVVDAMFPSTNQ